MATVDLPLENSVKKSLVQARTTAPHVIAITSGKGKPPACGKNAITASENQHESLSKLRTRLLTMIAQGDIPAQALTAFINELSKAVRRTYPDTRPAKPERINSPEPEKPITTSEITPLQHRYNENRFGSQHQLLATLRQHSDQPLIHVLSDVADRPS